MAILSALLCAAVCAGAGWVTAWQLQARQRLIAWWEEALARMEGAALRECALPEMLRLGDGGRHGPLEQAAALLHFRPTIDPEEWLAAVPREPLLKKAEQAVLDACLLGLWAPHPQLQGQCLARAREAWRGVAHQAASRQGRIKLYRQLGLLGGAAAFILLC